MLEAQLVETWDINNRISLYLLDALAPDQLLTPLQKGKTVEGQFAHIHNVRLMWLKASAPDLFDAQTKIEGSTNQANLRKHLQQSGEAVGKLIARSLEKDGKIKNFKPHVCAFVGYLIAHDANHRAHVELALRQTGTPLSDKVAYGLWEWGTR